MTEVEHVVLRRAMRLLHVPPLALLLGLGLAPFFILFPDLPGEPGRDPSVQQVELWLGVALLGGLLGSVEGAARPLYRIGGFILAATLLSFFAMRALLWLESPFPHGLSTLLGLDGESSMDAGLYEIWLVAWIICLGAALLCWRLIRRRTVVFGRGPSSTRQSAT